jgi:hypothetical protein
MAIKIYHEAPKSIFKQIQTVTDGDYALVHLFEEDPEYLNLFLQAKENGREIILDNSIFELEKAFDADRFAYWVNELQPTWYIIPDSLENSQQTIENMLDWNEKYASKVTGKKIGVVQGKTYSEIVECYDFMANHADVDMIAISFDYSYFEQEIPHPNKYVSWMLGRVQLLGRMLRDGIIDTSMKHHLLGNSLPLEGKFYKNYDWIYSMDISNPITHGIKGIAYQPNFGLYTKVSQKLFTMINTQVTDKQKQDILHNIQEFRKYWVEDQL